MGEPNSSLKVSKPARCSSFRLKKKRDGVKNQFVKNRRVVTLVKNLVVTLLATLLLTLLTLVLQLLVIFSRTWGNCWGPSTDWIQRLWQRRKQSLDGALGVELVDLRRCILVMEFRIQKWKGIASILKENKVELDVLVGKAGTSLLKLTQSTYSLQRLLQQISASHRKWALQLKASIIPRKRATSAKTNVGAEEEPVLQLEGKNGCDNKRLSSLL